MLYLLKPLVKRKNVFSTDKSFAGLKTEDNSMAMESKERVIAALKLKQPDRVPTLNYLWDHAAIVAGVKCSDMRNDQQIATKAIAAAYEKYKPDAVVSHHDRLWHFGDFGVKITSPDFDQPSVEGQYFKKPEDAFILGVPDPYSKKESPMWWRAVDHVDTLMGTIGDRCAVFAMHLGVFSMALLLRRASEFMLDLAENQEAAHKIMDSLTSMLIERCKIWIDHGVRFFMDADPGPSCELISPRHFSEFAKPYLKRLHLEAKKYAREKYGAPFYIILHICGDNTLILEQMAEVEADCLSLDQRVDLGVAKKKAGGKVAIMGNIDPSDVLLLGTPEAVDKTSKACIMKAGKGGGYILSQGCMVAIKTPFENVQAMIDAAAKYGTYQLADSLS